MIADFSKIRSVFLYVSLYRWWLATVAFVAMVGIETG